MFQVAKQEAEFGPVVFVGVFDLSHEEGECCAAVAAGSRHKEENLCNSVVKDFYLLFREWDPFHLSRPDQHTQPIQLT